MRATSRAERARRDRELQRAAANRRVGHDHAYLILYGRWVTLGVVLLLLIAAATWAWVSIDHARVAGVVGLAGIVILAVYAAWLARHAGVAGRMMALARGRTSSAHWHLAGTAGVLLVLSAVMIWTQLP